MSPYPFGGSVSPKPAGTLIQQGDCAQDLLKEMGCELREYPWPDYWYFGKERRMMGSAEKVRLRGIDTEVFISRYWYK